MGQNCVYLYHHWLHTVMCLHFHLLHFLSWDPRTERKPSSGVVFAGVMLHCMLWLETQWGLTSGGGGVRWHCGDTGGHWGTLGDTLGTGQTRPGDITACILIYSHHHTQSSTINTYTSTYIIISYIYIDIYIISTYVHQHWAKKTIVHPDVCILFDFWSFDVLMGSCFSLF